MERNQKSTSIAEDLGAEFKTFTTLDISEFVELEGELSRMNPAEMLSLEVSSPLAGLTSLDELVDILGINREEGVLEGDNSSFTGHENTLPNGYTFHTEDRWPI